MEEAIRAVNGVVNVESTTNPGFAFLVVRNEFGVSQDVMLERIEGAVNDVALPTDMDAPQILDFSLSDLPVVTVSVSSGELSLDELKALVESELVPELTAIEQVSQVTVSGARLTRSHVRSAGAGRRRDRSRGRNTHHRTHPHRRTHA
ncbi:MAG: efflux RND transporter permease subunit [Chloroflexi bacterium]|nr:efflux RND transporter permease subunit [Chloroflexota bacterium]